MAEITVFVPDGEFCSDQNHLDCLYDRAMYGFHRCDIYGEELGQMRRITVGGESQRVVRKCETCLNAMRNDGGNGIAADRPDV